VRTLGKALTTKGVRRRIYYPSVRRAVWGKPPPPDTEFMQELRVRFKPEVVALSEHLGRDLVTLWGYDDIG
jgi:hypothetical protein